MLTIPTAWNWGAKTGLFYAGTNLLCNIWCWFRLPETKDRSFGEIDLMFENQVPARKFKYTKVDRMWSFHLSSIVHIANTDEQSSPSPRSRWKRPSWRRRSSLASSIEISLLCN